MNDQYFFFFRERNRFPIRTIFSSQLFIKLSRIEGAKMKVFLIFWIASVIGAIAVTPYQFKMLQGKIEEERRNKPGKKVPSTPVLMLISVFQSALLLGVASYVGTRFAPKVDLHWYIVDNWLFGIDIPYSVPTMIVVAILAGLLLSILIIAIDMAFAKKMPKIDMPLPSRKQSLLASLYGGISEEVLTRLFIMTITVYLTSLIGLEDSAYWIGIVVAALLFGVGHLPAAIQAIGKTKVVVIRTILLNTIPGIVFGYLYWKYGIEIAMISHFAADIGLHVVFGPWYRNKIGQK